jgi:hypothetical protein
MQAVLLRIPFVLGAIHLAKAQQPVKPCWIPVGDGDSKNAGSRDYDTSH